MDPKGCEHWRPPRKMIIALRTPEQEQARLRKNALELERKRRVKSKESKREQQRERQREKEKRETVDRRARMIASGVIPRWRAYVIR